MAVTQERKAECIASIRQHLATRGSSDWASLIDQFPDVSDASIWRWIREAKNSHEPAQLVTAQAKLRQRVKKHGVDAGAIGGVPGKIQPGEVATMRHLSRQLPAVPSPAYVAREGEAALQKLDFAAELNHLYGDALMIREYATKKLEDGSEAIKNPVMFERQIMARAKLIDTAINTLREIWDLRTMQDAFAAVLEEVAAESPDCQRRILARLQALNSRVGMSMFAKF